VCEAISDPALAFDAVSEVLHSRRAPLGDTGLHVVRTSWASLFARPEMTLMVARDQSDRPLAVIAAVIDDIVCLIEVAVASNYEARWALHHHLVRMLIDRGVTHLLATGGGRFGALGFTENEQYYQHLLGYELHHLIPANPQSMTRRRRLVASLVVAAVTAAAFIAPSAAASAAVIRAASLAPRTAPAAIPVRLATSQRPSPWEGPYGHDHSELTAGG
jgi:hypothetical protein